jgi:hypothetical protein
MEEANREGRAASHPAPGREISIMMNFHSPIDLQVTQDFPNCWMGDLINGLAAFDLRIYHPDFVFEERRKITAV